MSLTSIIKNVHFKGLRDKFKASFPRPLIKVSGPILAAPLTNNSGIVGQAFDYLLRFILIREHKNKITSRSSWVAEDSYHTILFHLEMTKSKSIMVGYFRDAKRNRLKFIDLLKSEFKLAKINYKKFIKDGIYTDSLMRSALFLARLDVAARVGTIDANFGNEVEADVLDLKNLTSIIKLDDFQIETMGFVNPSFGEASRFVNGADADLILDDILIEIKVTRKMEIKREYLNQLLGYYILSLISGVNKDKRLKPIKYIGIYFARFGILWKIAIKDLANENDVNEFKRWFVCYIDEHIWDGQIAKRPEAKRIKLQKKKI